MKSIYRYHLMSTQKDSECYVSMQQRASLWMPDRVLALVVLFLYNSAFRGRGSENYTIQTGK